VNIFLEQDHNQFFPKGCNPIFSLFPNNFHKIDHEFSMLLKNRKNKWVQIGMLMEYRVKLLFGKTELKAQMDK
jgi:hypothetical protein